MGEEGTERERDRGRRERDGQVKAPRCLSIYHDPGFVLGTLGTQRATGHVPHTEKLSFKPELKDKGTASGRMRKTATRKSRTRWIELVFEKNV